MNHGSHHIDADHQLMVRKAAGQLSEFMEKASPHEVADAFIQALDLEEPELLRMAFSDPEHDQVDHLIRLSGKLKRIKRTAPFADVDYSGLLGMDLPVEVSLVHHYSHNAKGNRR